MIPAISFEEVGLRYGSREVLRHFNFAVQSGEVVALLGPSGSGKTSVLRLLLGFVAPSTGTIRLGEEIVSRSGETMKPPEERGIGVVFQDLALWPHLSVRGNLAFGLDARGVRRAERAARISAMLERVGLSSRADSAPGDLSGGERQRVAIARAMVLEPRAVLLDEPFSNLDVGLKRELLSMFRELLKERHTTAVFVTHDLREAAILSDQIAVLEAGGIIQQGPLDALREHPGSDFVRGLVNDLVWQGAERQ